MHMTEKITKSELIGTWMLIDFKITKPNGVTNDWGPKSNGVLIYDESGHMSISINSGADQKVASQDLNKHILFYAGTYKVTGDNQIHHMVTNASDPNRIGKEMIRKAEITNQKYLRLTADAEYGHANLLWQKA